VELSTETRAATRLLDERAFSSVGTPYFGSGPGSRDGGCIVFALNPRIVVRRPTRCAARQKGRSGSGGAVRRARHLLNCGRFGLTSDMRPRQFGRRSMLGLLRENGRRTIETVNETSAVAPRRRPWNKGKLIGPKPPLQPKHAWAISDAVAARTGRECLLHATTLIRNYCI
jgi:hypothetical protein